MSCPAVDAEACMDLDGRPGGRGPSPEELQLRMKAPRDPIFKSLTLLQAPRTRPSVVEAELAGVWAAPSYSAIAAEAAAATRRLEGYGVFEPGSVRVSLERGAGGYAAR